MPVIRIDTDLRHLTKNKLKEQYQPATTSFIGPNGEELTFSGEIRSRGNMRKKVCHYPPLKLNLKKGELDSLGFKKADKLKFVVSCKSSKANEERAMKENLVYQLYGVLDTNAMQSKLVQVEFWQEGKLKKSLTGFLVEEEEHYAKRTGVTVVESGVVRSAALHRSSYLKMVLFQYMIANTDWAVPNKHNVEIAKVPGLKRVCAIPYDFDYSGLVGQPYAVPSEKLPIKDVQERYIMCTNFREAEIPPMREYFNSIHDELKAVCDSASYLGEGGQKDVKQYIKSFYKILNNESLAKKKFLR